MVLNLIPADVGRPLGQINTNLVVADLELLAQETIDTFMPKEMEVQDRSGGWYSLRIRPYRNVDNRIDGAVLTLVDIGAAKMYQQQIEQSRNQLLQTVDLMREPVLVLDQTLHVKTANHAFYDLFGFHADSTVGKALLELDSPRFSSSRLNALAQQLQGLGRPIENVIIDGDESGTHACLRASGRQFQLGDGKYWTVVTLTSVHGQLEKQQAES